ncbi:hypothetical protein OPQ81_005383 [Rhizoctonia solani]|nr:hypothetical protein OPQ81_005383 [Rhizoctonia solani]
MDPPKQGILRLQAHKGKENIIPSSLPRLSVKKDSNQSSALLIRKISGSQPTLGAVALRSQVDALRAENAKLRKEHQRELAKSQEKSSQLESRVQELVREKLVRDSEHAEAEREHRMASQRETALRMALEKSEAALKQLNERSGKLGGVERKLEDMERIHSDEKRKLTQEISSLHSQLEVARTTINEYAARLRERDTSKRFETRARELEARIQERDSRIQELEEELATAEAQAQVYEGRVQVYDKRVKAYKDRVRIAEQQARNTEAEIEALHAARASSNEETLKELAYAKTLLEQLAIAYGDLHARSQAKDRRIYALEVEVQDKGKKVATMEQMATWAEEERRHLADELDIRRRLASSEGWEGFWHTSHFEEEGSRDEVEELMLTALEGRREMCEMEVRKLELLAIDDHIPIPSTSSIPSFSASSNLSHSEELELARLRAECEALREEQESLEQDLVDAAMESEEHTRQVAAYQELQVEYASLEAELARLRLQSVGPSAQPSHIRVQADLSRLETEHKQLQGEFLAYKQKMEETARAAAEHEARAILLNGLQSREHSLREQMDALRTRVALLEKDLADEKENVKRAERRLIQAKTVEDELREDIDEMMEALDRVDRFEDAYNILVGEVVRLGLSDDVLDKLQKSSEAPLNVSHAKQKLKYVEEVKKELDRMAQKLAQTERERDQARAQGVDLRRELSVFQTVTGLNGWMDQSRSASTPPVRSMMTPPGRVPSVPLERIMETPTNEGLGVVSNPSAPAPAERRISRALSIALEAENMTLTE